MGVRVRVERDLGHGPRALLCDVAQQLDGLRVPGGSNVAQLASLGRPLFGIQAARALLLGPGRAAPSERAGLRSGGWPHSFFDYAASHPVELHALECARCAEEALQQGIGAPATVCF